jgi:hypothetical protein
MQNLPARAVARWRIFFRKTKNNTIGAPRVQIGSFPRSRIRIVIPQLQEIDFLAFNAVVSAGFSV